MFVFPLRLRHLQNKVFEHSNSIFWWRKTLTTHFIMMYGNKEKSLGAKSGLYGGGPINSTFWPVNMALIWADVWELALPRWTMICLLLFVFRMSPKVLGKQIVVYQSELTVIFESLSNCARSDETKSLLRPGVHAKLNVCWCKKCPRMPLSHGMSHDDLELSVYARHKCSLTPRLFFRRPLRISYFSDRRP